MGNTEGVLLSEDKNLTSVPFQTYNPTLGCNILTHYSSSSSLLSIKKVKLLYCTINNQNQIVLINPHSAESYDIVNGNCVRKFEVPKTVYAVAASKSAGNFIIAYNTWIFQLINSETLQAVRQIIPEEIPGTITCLKSTDTECIAGHSSSAITVWRLPSYDLISTHSSIIPEGPVTCISYSARHRTYIAACDMRNTLNQDQFILNAYAKNTSSRKLQGGIGRCIDITVLDKRNLVIGLSDRKLIILWDIIIGSPVPYSVPNFMPEFKCSSLVCFEYTNISVIGLGMSYDSLALAELSYSEEEMKFVIDWKVKSVQKGVGEVTCMEVRDDLDCLVLGNSCSQAFIFNNIEVITRIQSKEDLPIFSLLNFELHKKEAVKNSDLPLFSIGVANLTLSPQPILSPHQPSPVSSSPQIKPHIEESKSIPLELKEKVKSKTNPPVANKETIRKIRERIEGKRNSFNGDLSHPPKDSELEIAPSNPLVPKAIKKELILEESKNITDPTSCIHKEIDIPQSLPKQTNKQVTPFEKFFKEKKAEILKDDESLKQREIVMRVTKLWAELSEEERANYKDPAPDLTS